MSIQFPNTGSFSFSNLTFPSFVSSGFDYILTQARFRILNLPAGVTVTISNIVLRGDGITNTLSLPNVTLSSTSFAPGLDDFQTLDTIANPLNFGNTRASFNIQISGGSLALGSTLIYQARYGDEGPNNTILFNGNISLIAVAPQPTFGLPADVVALITSRFGSVANFLRLKNQGYV
jgi:hypothetical protein